MRLSLIRDESGQNMVEYGLLIALIAVAVLATLSLLGPDITAMFQTVDSELEAAAR